MTVYLPNGGRTYRYDFWYRGQRYQGSTEQTRETDAVLFESRYKLQLRQEAGGIAAFDPKRTPRFSKWAAVYYDAKKTRVTRPDLIRRTLDVVLQFFAGPPSDPKKRLDGAPYHNLRLGHPIADPAWIEKFEAWMATRKDGAGIAGSTKNTYWSCLSGLYKVAMWPKYRKVTGVRMNPFLNLERARPNERITTLTVKQLRAWIAAAPYHVQLALVIGALAPKLRLHNILELQWAEHFDAKLTYITVQRHKTIRHARRPLTVVIVPQLREVLKAARKRSDHSHVITWRGGPVKSIKTALRLSADRAGVEYGIQAVTFHTLRHTMATMLAEMHSREGEPAFSEPLRAAVMGHLEIRTTQKYTHIRSAPERAAMTALARRVPIGDAVSPPPETFGKTFGTGKTRRRKKPRKTA